MESERIEKDFRANGAIEVFADLGRFREFSFKCCGGHVGRGKERMIDLKIFIVKKFVFVFENRFKKPGF